MRLILILFVALFSNVACGQLGVTTLGIQLKPIVPSKYFDSDSKILIEESNNLEFFPQLGWNFGMLMRKGFSDVFSLEAGINLVRRTYNLAAYKEGSSDQTKLKFRLTGYEIPVQGLIYVKLGGNLWMNASGGLSFDSYPTNLFNVSFLTVDTLNYTLEQRTFRRSWIQMALIANYGFEYRSNKSGYWYLGASYHRPFSNIATTRVGFKVGDHTTDFVVNLSGNYLTLDLRYFFHEDPEKHRIDGALR